jgi:ribose-phosphate pyrophosphokinase
VIKIATCSKTKHLFDKILNEELSSYKVELEITTFSDSEIGVQFKESIRGCDLFLFAETSSNLTELLLTIDAAKRSSCKSLTIILPYYGYGRQDKKDGHRGSLGASVMAHALQSFGVNRVVSIDLHADQIQGMFSIPLEHIKGHSIFIKYIQDNIDLTNTILCSPDAGGVYRVSKYCDKLNVSMVSINKRRDKPNSIASMELIGDVHNKHVIIIDDIVDTANSLVKAAILLKEKGALTVTCIATHPVLSGKAYDNIKNSLIDKLIISDTIKTTILDENKEIIKTVSCISVLEKVICNLIYDESISKINE